MKNLLTRTEVDTLIDSWWDLDERVFEIEMDGSRFNTQDDRDDAWDRAHKGLKLIEDKLIAATGVEPHTMREMLTALQLEPGSLIAYLGQLACGEVPAAMNLPTIA